MIGQGLQYGLQFAGGFAVRRSQQFCQGIARRGRAQCRQCFGCLEVWQRESRQGKRHGSRPLKTVCQLPTERGSGAAVASLRISSTRARREPSRPPSQVASVDRDFIRGCTSRDQDHDHVGRRTRHGFQGWSISATRRCRTGADSPLVGADCCGAAGAGPPSSSKFPNCVRVNATSTAIRARREADPQIAARLLVSPVQAGAEDTRFELVRGCSPTRFPSVRPRPLGESSAANNTRRLRVLANTIPGDRPEGVRRRSAGVVRAGGRVDRRGWGSARWASAPHVALSD